jgi:hypothetical protein
LKEYTEEQLIKLIDSSLKATGEDIRQGRIPLDGRARLPLPRQGEEPVPKSASSIPDAAE